MKSQFIKSLQFLVFPLLIISAATSAKELFPKPAELEHDVSFWRRVYTEIDTKSGFIHDAENLAVVYDTVKLQGSPRADSRTIKATKAKYAKILRRLASGKRTGLSATEQRVLSLWGKDVSNGRLRHAAGEIRFQLGQSDRFHEGLVRAGEWSQYIRKTLADRKLPQELAVLPHVESSFNPEAYSSVGAAGIWQFTRSTGRRYLNIDYVVDERMDPYKATVAAAQLLEHNYNLTGTWPLALTAYNHGVSGMRRATRKLGTKDIATIVRKYKGPTFGFASRNFYVAYLAALEIDRDPLKYFPPFKSAQPVDYDVIELPHYMHVETFERIFNLDVATLKRHNRALLEPVWGGSKRIPKGFEMKFPRQRLKRTAVELLAAVPTSERYAEQTPDLFHKVVRGDTISEIATRYGHSVRQIMALNGLNNSHHIRAGQQLRLPVPANMKDIRPADSAPFHRVARGDTISEIATRYGYSVDQVLALNGLNDKHTIYIGQVLQLPVPANTKAIELAEPTPSFHKVVRGDTVSEIATRYGYNVKQVMALNGLSGSHTIHVGQVLRLPVPENIGTTEQPAAVSDEPVQVEAQAVTLVASLSDAHDFEIQPPVEEEEPALADDAGSPLATVETASTLLVDPSDYTIEDDNTIEVQASETLGHYAEWLNVRASLLRRINGMPYGRPLVIGRRLKLDFSRVSKKEFEQRRVAYQKALQEAFFEAYHISSTNTHVVSRGESLWELSLRNFNVPIWLLRQYNPDLDLHNVRPGTVIVIPELVET